MPKKTKSLKKELEDLKKDFKKPSVKTKSPVVKTRGKVLAKDERIRNKKLSKEADLANKENYKKYKAKLRIQKLKVRAHSKEVLAGKVISTESYKPTVDSYSIELSNVRKSYISGDLETKILKGINVKIKHGQLVSILGPSGSGKTTLLNLISGLDKATEGDIFVLGKNLTLLKDSNLTKFRRNNVGFIFQQYNLLSNLTAKENAEVGANLASKKSKPLTIREIFETIGMIPQLNKYPHQMSGGEQQRVSIARALAKNPKILFGDEPTGALDEVMGRKVLEILIEINRRYKTTVILVTHNPNIAEISDLVIHIQNGLIHEQIVNKNPKKPSEISWS